MNHHSTLRRIEELGEVVSYEDALARCPHGVEDVTRAVRASRSIYRRTPPREFTWAVSHNDVSPTKTDLGEVSSVDVPCYRVIMGKGTAVRISPLYQYDGKKVEGNWSF